MVALLEICRKKCMTEKLKYNSKIINLELRASKHPIKWMKGDLCRNIVQRRMTTNGQINVTLLSQNPIVLKIGQYLNSQILHSPIKRVSQNNPLQCTIAFIHSMSQNTIMMIYVEILILHLSKKTFLILTFALRKTLQKWMVFMPNWMENKSRGKENMITRCLSNREERPNMSLGTRINLSKITTHQRTYELLKKYYKTYKSYMNILG